MGILSVYQSHRSPFNFFSTAFSKSNISVDRVDIEQRAREEIFIPYRIVVSNNSNSHWLLEEDDELFHSLWGECMEYIKNALSNGGGKPLDPNTWEKLVVSESIRFEFKNGIKSSLIRWFLNIPQSSSQEQSENIHKIIVLPSEDINQNNTIYILTEKNLYKYVIPFKKNAMVKSDYRNIIKKLESDRRLIKYNLVLEIDPNKQWPFKIPSDTLCVVSGLKYKEYSSFIYSLGIKDLDIEEKAAIILGNEKESYDRYIIDDYDTLVFKSLNNTYKLHSDGLLEYKYTPGAAEQDRGDMGEAFEKAYTFINRIKDFFLGSGMKIYLTCVSESNPYYFEFVFNYMANGCPVYLNYKLQGSSSDRENKGNLRNAITVGVDSKRIIGCDWLLMNIDRDMERREYNVYFQDMLDEISQKYGKQELTDFAIESTVVGYLIDSRYGKKIKPVWVVEKPNADFYYIPMIQKKDDY
jgi:hypothetical protein